MSEIGDAFEAQTGIEVYDLFDDPRSDTLISQEYPISTGRFVTIRYDAYAVTRWGRDVGFHIHVWEDRKLSEATFVNINTIFQEDGYVKIYKNGLDGEFFKIVDGHIRLGTFKINSETGQRYDIWDVGLWPTELVFLKDKLRPVLDYTPPEEEE